MQTFYTFSFETPQGTPIRGIYDSEDECRTRAERHAGVYYEAAEEANVHFETVEAASEKEAGKAVFANDRSHPVGTPSESEPGGDVLEGANPEDADGPVEGGDGTPGALDSGSTRRL
jgi:hypothetical protein